MTLREVSEAATLISDASDPDANIIFGAIVDDVLGDEMRVTVIAAGLDSGRRGGLTGFASGSFSTTATIPPVNRGSDDMASVDDLEIPGFVQG